MSRLCSMCGKESQDPEFCDYCNADLGATGKNLPPERCPLATEGVALSMPERHVLLFPEASILVQGPEQAWRVHWLSEYDWQERRQAIEQRLALHLAPLPEGRVVEEPFGRWLAFEARPAPAWSMPSGRDWLDDLSRLSAHVTSLSDALATLHRQSLVWLNFDPNFLEDAGSSEPSEARGLRITNLGIELFSFDRMPERVRIHPHYAAPEIVQFSGAHIGPHTDVYHLAMFAYYWLAGRLPDGLRGNGLESHEFAMPFLRIFAPHLPTGIIPVVERGLALQPSDRHATPQTFVLALDEAIAAAQRRKAFDGPLRWDLGGQTRTGRAKAKLQRGNEDAVLIRADEQSALALVADGVSTCDIGSGGLASMMATIVVENAFAEGGTHDTFPALITAAALRGSQGLLEWALAHHCLADLEAGKDLMGTTLTVAWLQGHELSVANLGDSRAYLITEDFIEQLTVDGDLASDSLARGTAPEEIRELGAMARALRECVGGCIRKDDGAVAILVESSTPKIGRWPLLPGDTVVLCSDGLVEEGFFLEPETVAQIIRKNRERSASELAEMLVEAADALQRLPSVFEPDGFGDNISCVVIRVME